MNRHSQISIICVRAWIQSFQRLQTSKSCLYNNKLQCYKLTLLNDKAEQNEQNLTPYLLCIYLSAFADSLTNLLLAIEKSPSTAATIYIYSVDCWWIVITNHFTWNSHEQRSQSAYVRYASRIDYHILRCQVHTAAWIVIEFEEESRNRNVSLQSK